MFSQSIPGMRGFLAFFHTSWPMLLKLLITYLNYSSPSLTLCSSFASVSSSWRIYRRVLTLMCSWRVFPLTACGTWWILINITPFLWPSVWPVMHSHPKASFLSIASQTMRGYLDKDPKQFRAYFLALFAEKEYTRVLDRISKVDKSLLCGSY